MRKRNKEHQKEESGSIAQLKKRQGFEESFFTTREKKKKKSKKTTEFTHCTNEKKKRWSKETGGGAKKQLDSTGWKEVKGGEFKTRAPGLRQREGSGQQRKFQPANSNHQNESRCQQWVAITHAHMYAATLTNSEQRWQGLADVKQRKRKKNRKGNENLK